MTETQKAITFSTCTVAVANHNGRGSVEREAIAIEWHDVEVLLGHTHRGIKEDDDTIEKSVLAHDDCPNWMAMDTDGDVDEDYYYLLGLITAEGER